jgi:hypothetical protein
LWDVAAGAAASNYGDALVDEPLGEDPDPDAIGGGFDVVENAVFLLFRLAEGARRRAGLQHCSRTRDDVGIARHLVVVV